MQMMGYVLAYLGGISMFAAFGIACMIAWDGIPEIDEEEDL